MRGATLLTLILALGALSGCLSDDADEDDQEPVDTNDGGGQNNTTQPETVEMTVGLTGAYPLDIAYDPATITVPANSTVNLTFTNNEANPVPNHDWVLEGYEEEASTQVIGNGESDTITFTAPPPGTYTFYCSVPGHRDNGMEGTFTVEA